jgi:hypothetical protein
MSSCYGLEGLINLIRGLIRMISCFNNQFRDSKPFRKKYTIDRAYIISAKDPIKKLFLVWY